MDPALTKRTLHPGPTGYRTTVRQKAGKDKQKKKFIFVLDLTFCAPHTRRVNTPAQQLSSPLTPVQLQALKAIHSYRKVNGRAPSWRNLAASLKVAPTTVRETVARLKSKGYVGHEPGAYLSLTVTQRGTRAINAAEN